jgi:hypothetical protein
MPIIPSIVGHDRSPLQSGAQWPPSVDQPVSFDARGKVRSTFSDRIWNFSASVGRSCTISFGEGLVPVG